MNFYSKAQERPHVAVIMDGSGRWATSRGLPRIEGHRAGRSAVCRTVLAALAENISVLTLFTFSTENWHRPDAEVSALMKTFEGFFREDARLLAAKGARVSCIGRRNRLPATLVESIELAESLHSHNQQLDVRFALDYSGRDAIVAAASRYRESPSTPESDFARLVFDAKQEGNPSPDIDLLIRTGGELRLSNCPLWEIAYAELYFTPCLWPDFGATELGAALLDFHTRDRRFGRIPEEFPVGTVE
jgi:undecaprenyl diphosphate synthase